MPSIYHLAPSADIDQAARAGHYSPLSLSTDGFIHCSYAHQVQLAADTLFRDTPSLVLLEIDPARLTSRVVDETATNTSDAHPHIYGPLAMSAVVSVRELKRSFDGRYEMPCTVTGNCACKTGE